MDADAHQSRAMVRSIRGVEARVGRIEEGLARVESRLVAVERELHGVSVEQVSLAISVENAIARALRANLRLDEMQDTQPAAMD